ncbi:MAG: hypothetical protein KVP17_001153 [Porospora cf. gigantea B]|nr:MAG: hypothetical protein KVP17_001153 [Porospora cf. gigantea B]
MSALTFDWRVASGEMPLAAVVRGLVEHPYTLEKLDNVFAWPMVSIYHADDVSESLEHLAKSREFHRKDEILLRLLTSDSYTPDDSTLGVVTAVATLVIAHVAVHYLISHQARWGRLELSDVQRSIREADLGFRLEPSPKVVFIILRILLLSFCMRRRRMVITVLLLWTALSIFSYASRWSSTNHASNFVEDWKQRFGLDHPELEKTWKESCCVSPDVQGILWLTFFRGLYKSVFYPPKPLQESKSIAFHTYVKVCRTGFAANCPAIQFARVLKLICASVLIVISLAGSLFPQGWTILFHDSHTFGLLRNHPILLSVCLYSFFSLFFDFLIELFEPFAAAWALTVKRQRQVGRLVTAIPVTKRTVDNSVAKHWGLTYHHLNWKARPHRLYAEGDEGYLFDDLAVEPTDGLHDVTAVSDIEGWVATAYFFAMIHACEAKRIAWTLHSYFLIGVCGLAGVIVTDWFAFESLSADHVFLSVAVMAFFLHCLLTVGVLEFRRQEDLEVQWLHHWRATLPLGAGMGKFLDGATATIKSTDIDFYPAVDSFRSWILLASIFGCSITLLMHSWRDAVRIALLRLPTPLKAPW